MSLWMVSFFPPPNLKKNRNHRIPVLVVCELKSKGAKMKQLNRRIAVEEGMERLADFIKDTHGAQDWENAAYTIQDYLAAFLGADKTDVYQDLIKRLGEVEAD